MLEALDRGIHGYFPFSHSGRLRRDRLDDWLTDELDEAIDEILDDFEGFDEFLTASQMSRAVQRNQVLSSQLGWQSHYDAIVRLLAATGCLRPNYSPGWQDLSAAIACWQQRQGLTADGIIGRNTWRRLQGIFGRPTVPSQVKPSSPTQKALTYGVPGGTLLDPFYRDLDAKFIKKGKRTGRSRHLGIDVQARRGSPVYATLRPDVSIEKLNRYSLGISGQGMATLQYAKVFPWGISWDRQPGGYGGAVTLVCVYNYRRLNDLRAYFTLSIEYLHLITEQHPPKDDSGRLLEYANGRTLGPRMRHGAILYADELTGSSPLLVGYLGATRTPHVHIQASYRDGEYKTRPRRTDIKFDPTIMLY